MNRKIKKKVINEIWADNKMNLKYKFCRQMWGVFLEYKWNIYDILHTVIYA